MKPLEVFAVKLMEPLFQPFPRKTFSGNRGTSVTYLHFFKLLSCDTLDDIRLFSRSQQLFWVQGIAIRAVNRIDSNALALQYKGENIPIFVANTSMESAANISGAFSSRASLSTSPTLIRVPGGMIRPVPRSVPFSIQCRTIDSSNRAKTNFFSG